MNIIPQKYQGDCRKVMAELEAKRFHTCVCSPPYWGLRSYLPAGHPLKHLEIGSEETLEAYLNNLMEVFAEVYRVLRDDGTLWLNLGDRYTSGSRKGRRYDPSADHPGADVYRPGDPLGCKAKELLLLPQRVAMELQKNGWYLRSMCPWIKRNVMPESVRDRPCNALEYFFMFTKQQDYFYDRDAVLVRASDNTHPRAAVFPHHSMRDNNRRRRKTNPKAAMATIGVKQNPSFQDGISNYIVSQRNFRNTELFLQSWEGLLGDEDGMPLALVVNPKGTQMAHFATYPPKLVRPLIQASTSEGGCCSNCGAPRLRVIELGEPLKEAKANCGADLFGGYNGQSRPGSEESKAQNPSDVKRRILAGMVDRKTVGWKPGCTCDHDQACQLISIPCRVLDPFHGTGSTQEAAVSLGRNYTGIDLSEEYLRASDVRDQTALAIL